MELFTLEMADVRKEWHWIRDKIDEVQRSYSRDWRTEDVYAALVFGKARLYICKTEIIPKTVFVMQVITNEFTLKRSLFIWICHTHNMLTEGVHLHDLKTIAHELGCESIYFSSPRSGWDKIHSFKRVMSDYEINVEN